MEAIAHQIEQKRKSIILNYKSMKKTLLLIPLAFSFIACEEIIEVKDISNKAVSILAPTNNAVLDTIAVTFTWEAVEATETYHLQIATPDFENATQIVKDSTLTTTHFSTMLDTKSYEWRIRAQNSEYVTDYTTQQFTIEE